MIYDMIQLPLTLIFIAMHYYLIFCDDKKSQLAALKTITIGAIVGNIPNIVFFVFGIIILANPEKQCSKYGREVVDWVWVRTIALPLVFMFSTIAGRFCTCLPPPKGVVEHSSSSSGTGLSVV